MKTLIRTIIKLLLKIIFKTFFNIKAKGLENINLDGPSILMPNHTSFIDALLLFVYLPKNVTFVINTNMGKQFRFILPFINHVLIDPLNPYSMKKIIKQVKQGNALVIFPEGRITTTGNLMKIYSGVALVVAKTDANIYPIIIMGAEYTIFSRISNKVNAKFFTPIYINIFPRAQIDVGIAQNFRTKKVEFSNKLLALLQESKFQTKQELEKADNLFDKFLMTGKFYGFNKQIIKDTSSKLTYKKAIISAYILGSKFGKILKQEDRAGILLPNSLANFIAMMGMFYAGKSAAMLNFTAGTANIIDCINTTDLKTIFTSRQFIEKGKLENLLKQLESNFRIVYLEDVKAGINIINKIGGLIKFITKERAASNANNTVVLYTSGSENKPKGVVLSHENIISNVNQIACVIDFTEKDKMLNALPMFHSFGLTAGTFLPVLNGISLYLYPTPLHYKVIPEIAYDENITFLLGTPSFLMGYGKTAHPYDFTSLRYVIAGGEKLKEDVRNLWSTKFGIRLLEGYGTTETSPVLSVNTPLLCRQGTVGRLLPGIEYKLEPVEGIKDGGSLYIKGPNVMQGYLLHDKGFVKQSEWYSTGDVVSLDEDGFVTIRSRLKRFAKISGEMVSLDMVETLAMECFQMVVAVISIFDNKKGERIVLCSTSDSVNKRDFREYLATKGQTMLVLPSEILLMEKLPLLGNGKIDYVSIKNEVESKRNR